MNDFDAFIKRTAGGQHHAMLRTASDAEVRPILAKGGLPCLYDTELDAAKALLEHLLRYMNGHYVRSGEVAGETAAAANAAFKVVKQKGKTRQIQVTYRRGRAPV